MRMYAGIAHNKMLDEPNDKGKHTPMIEVIVLTNEPQYEYGAGGVSKSYRLVDSRFMGTPDALREMAERLVDMADEAESMAAAVNKAMANDDVAA